MVKYNINRITEIDQGIIGTIEVISEEEILQRICDQIRITEVGTEENIEMIIMKEVEVGLVIDNIQIIPQGMIGLRQV